MKKLTKRERKTVISYNQTDDPVEIYTHDLQLKRRLLALCEEYPGVCELIDVDEHGGHCFLADKERISIHVTRPYSEERRKKQCEWAKKNGMKGNQSTKSGTLFRKKIMYPENQKMCRGGRMPAMTERRISADRI